MHAVNIADGRVQNDLLLKPKLVPIYNVILCLLVLTTVLTHGPACFTERFSYTYL